MSTHTFYEFPLNERIRVFMRLEQLFQQFEHFVEGATIFDKRAAISALLDIMKIFNRNDLKSEILKELDRQSKTLSDLLSNKEIDSEKLDRFIKSVNGLSKNLYKTNGKISIKIMESGLFKSISQRSSIPGGMCSFDLPEYHYWLEQGHHVQQQDLKQWIEPFVGIRNALKFILNFIRQSSTATQEIAETGFFQSGLEQAKPFQLLRVAIETSSPCFAEISGGKQRFTIRFMSKSPNKVRPSQVGDNISFSLTRCAF